jgi:hypothetical protein
VAEVEANERKEREKETTIEKRNNIMDILLFLLIMRNCFNKHFSMELSRSKENYSSKRSI